MAKIFGIFDEKGLSLCRDHNVGDEVEQLEVAAVDILAQSLQSSLLSKERINRIGTC